ncbi:MAG: Lrp/AsnC family transcriptional regulator [Terracidiphilus sp.]
MPHRTLPNVVDLDSIAWKILEALQHNARLSFAELGRKTGLSTPAVAERVHRLEEAGVISGYHAAIDMAKLGVPIHVLVRLTIPGGDLQVRRSVAAIKELSEVSRCYRITGAESFVIEANVVSIRHLEALIDNLSALGATSTSTILSSPVERREYQATQIESFAKYNEP